MKLNIIATSRFKKDLKLAKKRHKDLQKLKLVIDLLTGGEDLPPRFRDHALSGKYAKTRECHLEPDWLLVYEINDKNLFLILDRLGSHAELFKK